MAYIASFAIEGLSGRPDILEYDLEPDVNIFWGLNGSGKTSLLSILDGALSNQAAHLKDTPFRSASVVLVFRSSLLKRDIVIRRSLVKKMAMAIEDGEIESTSEMVEIGDGIWTEVTHSAPDEWVTEIVSGVEPGDQQPKINKLAHVFLPISRFSGSTRGGTPLSWGRSREREFDDETLSAMFEQRVKDRWQRYNSLSSSRIRAVQQEGLATILALVFGGSTGSDIAVPSDQSGEAAHGAVTQFLKEQGITLKVGVEDFLRRYDKQPELQEVVAKIAEVAEEIEAIMRPQLEFQQAIDRFYVGDKHLELNDRPSLSSRAASLDIRFGDERVPLKSLSSGEKQMLQLLLEVLAAGRNAVIIDEPELSMHVDWQLKLVKSMMTINPGCQLILATHSPEIMAEIEDRTVRELV
ncbi:AAA family ATPase [Tsukamurella ocularis]|uniref:AAA family ATPase n=1 Tax=Tsukamurella ocularis TaxID=1970234 RepID=UPI0039F0849F